MTQVQLFKRIAPDISIEPSSCWNCRSSDFHLSYLALDRCTNSPGLWEIVSCNSCGSTRTLLRVKHESLLKLYSDEHLAYGFLKLPTLNTVTTSHWSSRLKTLVRNFILSSFFNYRHLSFIRIPSQFSIFFSLVVRSYFGLLIPVYTSHSRNKLLEIGCSDGIFLNSLQSLGWLTTGIEISPSAVESARSRTLNIHNVSFADFDSQGNTYNCIVMRRFPDHFSSPGALIHKVHNLLDYDGVFLFSAPNFLGFESRMFRDSSFTLHSPTHSSHFTVDSLSELLRSSGFHVQSITHHTSYRDLRSGLQNIYSEKPNFILSLLLKLPLSLFKIISYALGLFGISTRVSIYAKKI